MLSGILHTQPAPALPSLEKVSWSFSRMQAIDSCLRKYYYQYFGGKKLAAQDEQDKDTINYLKQFFNEHLIVGEIVHYVIRVYLNNKRKGVYWDLVRVKGFGNRLLKDAINYSEELRNGIFKEYKHIPRSIMEIYYDEVEANELRNRVRHQIDHLLENFYLSETFQPLREGALHEQALIERKIGFDLPGVHVDGVVDLMFPYGDKWIIVDWKTGSKEVEETSLQLLVYGQWLMRHKGIEKEKIFIKKAYLNESILEPLEFSDFHLKRSRGRIIQDADRLIELEEFGQNGIIGAFPRCGQEKVCAQCPFKKICLKD